MQSQFLIILFLVFKRTCQLSQTSTSSYCCPVKRVKGIFTLYFQKNLYHQWRLCRYSTVTRAIYKHIYFTFQGHGSTNFLQSVTGLTIGDKNRNSIVGTITGGRFKKRSGILSLFSQNKVIIIEKLFCHQVETTLY